MTKRTNEHGVPPKRSSAERPTQKPKHLKKRGKGLKAYLESAPLGDLKIVRSREPARRVDLDGFD